MSAVSGEPVTVREQHLQALAPFCRGVGQAMSRGELTVEQAGGKIVIIPFVPGKSTTALLKKIMRL